MNETCFMMINSLVEMWQHRLCHL